MRKDPNRIEESLLYQKRPSNLSYGVATVLLIIIIFFCSFYSGNFSFKGLLAGIFIVALLVLLLIRKNFIVFSFYQTFFSIEYPFNFIGPKRREHSYDRIRNLYFHRSVFSHPAVVIEMKDKSKVGFDCDSLNAVIDLLKQLEALGVNVQVDKRFDIHYKKFNS